MKQLSSLSHNPLFHKSEPENKYIKQHSNFKTKKTQNKNMGLGIARRLLALAHVSAVAVATGRHGDGWNEIEREEI